MKKIINIAVAAAALLEAWILASWLNIVFTNCNPALNIASWNIFNVF